MTTRAGGVVVSVEASTLDFTRGMELAARSLLGFERASESATRTTNAIQRSVRSLALEAVGVSGPFARIGEHIIAALGPSSAPIVAAIAGAGIMVKLYADMRKGAEETEKQIQATAKANLDFVSGRNAVGGTARRVFGGTGEKGDGPNLVEQQTAAEDRLRKALEGIRRAETGTSALAVEQAREEYRNASRGVGAINQRLAQGKSELSDAAGKAAQSDIDAWREAAKKQFEAVKAQADAIAKRNLDGWKPGVIDTGGVLGLGGAASKALLASSKFRTPLTLDLANNQPFQDIKIQTAGEVYRRQAAAEDEAAKAAAKTVSQVRGLASGLDLLGAVAGQATTRVGQFISGIGGILGNVKGVDPLIGAGIEVGGALVNLLFGGHHNEPAPVKITNVDEFARAQRTGPLQVSLDVIGSNGEVVKTADVYIRRRQARDGVVRVPWGAAAA